MTDSLSSHRAEGQELVDERVERAIESLMDKLASPASVAVSASYSVSPPSPPSYQSTFLPLSPPPSPPSPAPSLSLLGKAALSNYYMQPHSTDTLPPTSPPSSHSPLPARLHFGSVSPPPVPLLFSRPSTVPPISRLSPPPRSHSHRSPPRVPSFSPPFEPITFIDPKQSPPISRPLTSEAAVLFTAPFHATNAKSTFERRREGESEVEDEWRISSDADVRRMLDELRDELQHIAHKLAAIKRYAARTHAQQQQTSSSEYASELENEYDVGPSPSLSPRTRHIMQLLEEADELLQYNKPAQPNNSTNGDTSRAGRQKGDMRRMDAIERRPYTAPTRSFDSSTTPSRSAGFVHSVASNHLLRAYDELLDRYKSQVLRIDATLATID